MKIPYKKMQGTGNIILVVDQRIENILPPSSKTLKVLSNEKTGPGFDQLMWIGQSTSNKYLATYRVFNRDGSEAEQCGNGVRCVAKYLSELEKNMKSLSLLSPAGSVIANIYEDDNVEVSMGIPKFEPSEIPFLTKERKLLYELSIDNKKIEINTLSLGNPHAILQVDNIDNAPVNRVGPLIENHSNFPNRTNVGFMRIIDRNNIELRVHERGAGETAACGTGACAAVISGQKLGLLDKRVSVQLLGGQVMVSWNGDNEPVWLKGNAVAVSDGFIEL